MKNFKLNGHTWPIIFLNDVSHRIVVWSLKWEVCRLSRIEQTLKNFSLEEEARKVSEAKESLKTTVEREQFEWKNAKK